jgi:hypothetical protein
MYHHCQHQGFGTETQGGSLVGTPACLCQQLVAAMSEQLCLHVTLLVYFLPAVCGAGLCGVGCHLEVLLLATLAAGVQEQRQAWGMAGTSPPHTVLVH